MNPQRWSQIKEIYGSVLDREPERREAFLDEACAGDETLRQEVASLLAQQKRVEGLLDSPAVDVAAKALAKDAAQALARELGRNCGSRGEAHESMLRNRLRHPAVLRRFRGAGSRLSRYLSGAARPGHEL